jgi:CheY-like chemotaxis protein
MSISEPALTAVANEEPSACVLIADSDIIIRHALGAYLRHCGYRVVEAATSDEAVLAVSKAGLSVDIILCDVAVLGSMSGFELSNWMRLKHPDIEVKLAASVERAAETAANLCDSGPHLARPYDPQSVVHYIHQRRATRVRTRKDT